MCHSAVVLCRRDLEHVYDLLALLFPLPIRRTVCAVHTHVGEKVTVVTRYTCDHKCTCCYYHALIMVVVTIPTTLVGLCMYHA